MQRLLLVCTASALRPQQARRRITMSAASVIVETDATDSVKITIGARTLQRTAGEPLQKALGRLAPKKKKGKKAAPAPPPAPPRLLTATDSEVDAATPLLEALSLGRWLELDGARLPVALNPPTVVSVECYGEPTAGSPLMPLAELKRADADDVSYRYTLDGEACGTGAAVLAVQRVAVAYVVRVGALQLREGHQRRARGRFAVALDGYDRRRVQGDRNASAVQLEPLS